MIKLSRFDWPQLLQICLNSAAICYFCVTLSFRTPVLPLVLLVAVATLGTRAFGVRLLLVHCSSSSLTPSLAHQLAKHSADASTKVVGVTARATCLPTISIALSRAGAGRTPWVSPPSAVPHDPTRDREPRRE